MNSAHAPEAGGSLSIQGNVHGGQQPVTASRLQLYAVGTTGDGSTATPMISAIISTSDGTGNAANSNANVGNGFNSLPAGSFTITNQYACPAQPTQVYLVATGGNPGLAQGTNNAALAMMAALGDCSQLQPTTNVFINELTTVGSIAPLVPYMVSYDHLGSGPADATQFLAALNLVKDYADSTNGTVPGPSLPANMYASSVEIQTLGDILAGCVNSSGGTPCTNLFTLTTPPGGSAPTDTIGAAINIIKYPTNNTAAIYNLLPPNSPFQPTLSTSPSNWSLPIVPIAATPVISPAGGSYATAPTVTITSATPGASIYYTTDGSTPTTASSLYTAGFTLTASGTVKAISAASGYGSSAIASAAYTLPPAGTATHLAFITQPGDTAVGYTVPSVLLGMYDAYGTAVATSGVSASVTFGSNPGSATLGGTKTATSAKDGSISFGTLTVSAAASGYTLTVTAAGLPPLTSNPFSVFPYKIVPSQTLQTPGVGRTTPGLITLTGAAPAGGLTVTLTIADPSIVSVSPSSIVIPAGSTTGTYTVTGLAAGSTLLTASAPNYASGTLTEYSTASYAQFGTIPAAGPGAVVTVPITLTAPAPSGGFTASLYSSNTSVATLSPTTITFAAGTTTATATVTLTGRGYGSTDLTIVPNYGGFGGDTKTVGTGSNTATLTSTLNFNVGGAPQTDTITLGSPAPAGGLTFTLSSSPASIVILPATVTVAAGATTATFSVTANSFAGSTTITATYAGITPPTTTVHVTGTLTVFQFLNGVGMITPAYYQQNNQSQGTNVTLTSSNPAVILLSASATGPFTPSITFPNSTGFANFYEQNVALGTSTVQVTAADYTVASNPITVNPVAVVVQPNSQFTTTAVSPNTTLTVAVAVVGFLNGNPYAQVCSGCTLSNGVTVSANVVSSNTSVGTIVTSPVTVGPSTSTTTFQFHPVSAGTTNINIGSEPTGFYDLSGTAYGSVATVTGGTISVSSTTDLTGAGVYVIKSGTTSISPTPPSPVTLTITSSNPAVAVISATSTVAGSSSISFPNISGSVPSFYVQGLSPGTTTLTYSAPGYNNSADTVTVNPAGVIIQSGALPFTTTTVGAGSFNLILAVYNPAGNSIQTFCFNGTSAVCAPNPGTSATVTLNDSNPAVATLGSSTATVPAAGYVSVSVSPQSAGSTTVSIASQTAPYTSVTSTTYTQGNITVTQPVLTASAYTTGASLYVAATAQLSVAPSSAKTLTVSSSNPSVAVLSTNASLAGSASVSFTNLSNTVNQTYYIQGLSPGTSTLTLSAPGYTNATNTITVLPSGIVFSTGTATFSQYVFSSSTKTLTLYTALLNASTGAVQSLCVNTGCLPNPGAGLSIPVISSNTAVGTIGTSPVTFSAGSTSATTTFVAKDIGTTVISLGTQPAAMSTSTTSGSVSGTATVTGDQIVVSSTQTGAGVEVMKFLLSLPVNPPHATTVTISVADPTLAVLSTSPTVLGTSGTLTITNQTGSALPTIYVQGLAAGNTRLVISAPQYITGSGALQVTKAGFVVATGPFAISTGNPNGSIASTLALLDPYSLAFLLNCNVGAYCQANPGQPTNLTLTTDDPTVGTVSPVSSAYDPNTSFVTNAFVPVNTGFVNYSLGVQPAGFYNTTTAEKLTARVAVNNPLTITSHDVDTAVGVQIATTFGLTGTSIYSINGTYTVTVADPTVAVITQNYALAGTQSFNVVSSGGVYNNGFYVQGLKEGVTTLSISLANYNTRTVTIRVNKSGLVLRVPDVTRQVTNGNTNILITPAVLDASQQWIADAVSNPTTTASVAVTSSNPAAGTIVTSPVTLPTGGFTGFNFTFHPVAAGSTTITLGTPSAIFSTATTYQSIGALVQ